MWETKTFSELTTKELYEILYLRTKTFVVDQERVYQEVDEHDLEAIHIFDMIDGKVAAYARVFPQGNNVTFGRVVTASKYRGQGLGKELMDYVLTAIQHNFPHKEIEIEAQVQVQDFYKKFNFESHGKSFLFNHTPHIKMTHPAI
ncbi:GNAT family N-acetyltransferase [Companilactobacillus heilongjiangensis]|uniref:GNAT family acetyltransferase n=1 Tax=Companilactobacillus heilongjiangensis TaxID=1074467 RepID=A0A0K2L9Z6_9LACO|nr:GNAT family N-acetyltransferase [Companilactobacillus heilongjiangensis]ALB28127.1 GNAT family acetyltransferase [Companilactobacillus heilongjiangensis]